MSPPVIDRSTKKKLLLIWAGVLAILSATLFGNMKAFALYRESETISLSARSAIVSNALADHSRQIMRQVDTILRGVQIHYLRLQSISDVREYITGLTIDEGTFSGIYIADQLGNISWTAGNVETRLSVADRAYFQNHRSNPDTGMIISPVVAGRATNAFNFHVSRRLNNQDGSFAGVVIATVNPKAFEDYVRNLGSNPVASIISLYGTLDHKLRFRIPVPAPSQWDQTIDSPMWTLLQQANNGHFKSTSPIDGVERNLYFTKVADYPLVTLSGFSDASLSADAFERDRWIIFGSIALISFIVFLALSASIAILRGARLASAKAELDSLYRDMERLAMTDSLTGLPGRTMFMDRLAQALALSRRDHKFVVVLFLDLDGFKLVNDRFGHDAGDQVLMAVARLWESCVRETDTLARLGGDEFAVILGGLEVSDDALPIARKLIDAVRQPVPVSDGKTYHVGVSVGISVYPRNALHIDSLLTAADNAMYASKTAGKNQYTVSAATPNAQDIDDHWLTFDESMRVGNALIDSQHRQLYDIVNGFSRAVKEGASSEQLEGRFNEILRCITLNSETEDALMREQQYPNQALHHNQHRRLILDLERVRTRFGVGGELLAMLRIKDWLSNHIQSDQEFEKFLNGSLHNDG